MKEQGATASQDLSQRKHVKTTIFFQFFYEMVCRLSRSWKCPILTLVRLLTQAQRLFSKISLRNLGQLKLPQSRCKDNQKAALRDYLSVVHSQNRGKCWAGSNRHLPSFWSYSILLLMTQMMEQKVYLLNLQVTTSFKKLKNKTGIQNYAETQEIQLEKR